VIHFRRMHDISTQLGVESVSWPGDPPYERYLVSSIAKGDAAEARRRTPIPARRDAPAAPGEGVAAGNANPLGAGLPIGTPRPPVVPPVHPPACPVGAVFSLAALPGIPPVGVLAALGREFLLTPGLSRRAGSAPGFGLF